MVTSLEPPATDAELGELTLRIRGTSRNGQIVRLKSAQCTIGSSENCTLRLRAPGVGPCHCLIVRKPGETTILRKSSNTKLNGCDFSEAALRNGDLLEIGPLTLEIASIGGEPKTSALINRTSQSNIVPSAPQTENLKTSKVDNESATTSAQVAPTHVQSEQGENIADALRAEIAALQESGEKSRKTWQTEKESLQWQIDDRAKQFARRENELLERASELESRKSRWDAEREEMRRRMAELEEEKQRALNEAAQALEAAKASESAESHRQDETKKELEAAKALESELDSRSAELNARAEELRAERTRCEELAASLQERSDSLQRQSDELAQRQATLDSRQAEFNSKQAEINAQSLDLDSKRSELDSRRKKIEAAEEALASATNEAEKRQEASKTDREEAERLRDELTNKKNECAGVQTEIEELRAELQMVREEAESLRSEAARLSADSEHSRKILDEIEELRASLATKENELNASREAWEERLSAKECELADREKKLAEQEEQWNDLQVKISLTKKDELAESAHEADDSSEEEEPVEEKKPYESVNLQDVFRRLGHNVDLSDDEDEGASDLPQPAPKVRQPNVKLPSKPVAPSFVSPETPEPSHDDEHDEGAISEYMAQLMNRVKGSSASEAATPAYDPSAHAEEKRQASKPTAPEPIPAYSIEPSFEKMQPVEMSPRAVAPEKNVNIAAFRDLANMSAHAALNTHARKEMQSSAISKLLVSVLAGIVGAGFLLMWNIRGRSHDLDFMTAMVSLAIALFWGVQYAVLTGRLIVNKSGRLELAKAQAAEMEDDSPRVLPPNPFSDREEQYPPSDALLEEMAIYHDSPQSETERE